MNSVALINKLLRSNSSWTRAELLSEIDVVQNMILENVKPSMRIVDTSTGKDPVLSTSGGVFEYELNLASFGYDVREIRGIRSFDGDEIQRVYNGYGRFGDVEEIKTFKAVGNTQSRVIFTYDPGDASFYIECYKAHQALVSENIQLSIPDNYVMTYLLQGVIGRLESFEHGFGASKAWFDFENTILPRLNFKMETEAGNMTVRTSINKQQRN